MLTLPLILVSTAFAVAQERPGFRLEGDRIENAKLTFDSRGIDRSSPEKIAEALLTVKVDVMTSRTFVTKFEEMEAATRDAYLKSTLTPESYARFYGSRNQRSERARKTSTSSKISPDGPRAEKEGAVSLPYKVETKSTEPCRSCEKKPSKTDCRACKGKGVRERDRTERYRIVAVKEGDSWRVKALLRECWSCKGSAKCSDHKPEKCSRCAGDGKCRSCKGDGYLADSFLRGPNFYEGLPTAAAATKADLSTPEAAVRTLLAGAEAIRLERARAESRMAAAFNDFTAAFLAKGVKTGRKARKYEAREYAVDKSAAANETRATVPYHRKRSGEKKDLYQADLAKGSDGAWHVTAIRTSCWSCQGTGKGRYGADKGKECRSCKGVGFRDSSYFPH